MRGAGAGSAFSGAAGADDGSAAGGRAGNGDVRERGERMDGGVSAGPYARVSGRMDERRQSGWRRAGIAGGDVAGSAYEDAVDWRRAGGVHFAGRAADGGVSRVAAVGVQVQAGVYGDAEDDVGGVAAEGMPDRVRAISGSGGRGGGDQFVCGAGTRISIRASTWWCW